jgi:uncharacterized protein YkwD
MDFLPKSLLLTLALTALVQPVPLFSAGQPPSAIGAVDPQIGNNQALRAKAEQLFVFGNQARAARGLRALEWDPALAAAALRHCERMAAEGAISHQFAGEPDLSERAGGAGAHFNLVEENVAVGPSPVSLHEAWMNSPHHLENLLNPEVNRVGYAVVARGDVLYAVADFAHSVAALSREQVEASVGRLLQVRGISVHPNPAGARIACAQDQGMPASLDGWRPEFIMRWQDAELTQLPEQLMDRIASGKYKEAVVGSCVPQTAEGTFTVYRVAVMLLKPGTASSRTLASAR